MRKILLVFLAFQACRASFAADVALVVNKANNTESLTKAQARKILLGEQTTWRNGQKIVVNMGPQGTRERAAALKVICSMSEADFTKALMQESFVGGDATRRTLPSIGAVLSVVHMVPGAIGIVGADSANESVKVLKIDGLAPGEAGYPLKTQ